jgi:hypothetical protein
MLTNGAAGTVLTSGGATAPPTWTLLRSYTVPFGVTVSGGTTTPVAAASILPARLFANVGPAGLFAPNDVVTASGAETQFVVPVDSTISLMTMAWDVGNSGTISIHINKNAASYTTPAGTLTTAGRTLTPIALSISVFAGNCIEVKVNSGAAPGVNIYNPISVMLYFA